MNSLERVMATGGGQAVDRRAFLPALSLYGARLTDCPLDLYYSSPARFAAGQEAVHDEFEPDVLFGPFAFAGIGEAFGCKLTWIRDQPPNIRKPAISSMDEWCKLKVPDIDTSAPLRFLRESVRRLANTFRGNVPIAVALPPPTDIPALVLGIDLWLELILFDRPRANEVLEHMNPFFVRLANSLFSDGATFLVLTCAFASPAVVNREVARSFTHPAMREAFAQLTGPVIVHHGGAPVLAHLDLLTGLPSVLGYVVGPEDDRERARQIIGPQPILLSGPSGPVLGHRRAEDIEQECQAILDERHEDLHYALCTTGADVPLWTPPENIHAMRNAILATGKADQ
jgi:uroporphyrinogen decarboxylase